MNAEPPPRKDLSEAHPMLAARVDSALEYMMTFGKPIRVTECWRTPERQAWLYDQHIHHGGSHAAPPGKSKHEHTVDGAPCSLAVDVCFTGPGVAPYYGQPWGLVRMVFTELCNLYAISRWDEQSESFEGDLCHFELRL